MTAIQSRFVHVEGLRLHYLEAGEGPAVLCVHGWPTQAQLYRHVLEALAPHRRVIAVDLPGFGLSDKPLEPKYGFTFYEKALTGLLDALDVERTGLVVHDLGGPVGLYWAMKNLERVTEIAMLNTLVFPELSWAVKVFVGASMVPGVRRLLSSPWGIERAMRFGVHDKSRITPEVAALYKEPFQDAQARRVLLKTASGLGPGGLKFIAESLSKVEVPVRLLYGEQDRILPDVAQTMARVQSLLPHAELSSIPDCGHFLQEDRPDEVAEALKAFFAHA